MSKTISKQANIVLEVVQEYLNKNRVLDMENVVPFIRHRFSRKNVNINDKGIKQILENLIENKYIVPGSKLIKNQILNNPNRKKIYQTIKQNPGIYFSRLLKTLDLANHVLAWHINILLKFDCIVKVKINGHEVYHHPSITTLKVRRSYYLSKAKSKEILSYFNRAGDKQITKTHLAKVLSTHYNTISKYVDILEDLGVLIKIEMDNKTLYEKVE
jgi:predicted transcriptional regulator